MKTTVDYWKDWWNERAKPGVDDLRIDRGGSKLTAGTGGLIEIDELERRSKEQLLAAVDPHSGDVVLDAGCGTGANFSMFSPIVREIVAVDFSEEQLRRAQHRIEVEKLTNIRLQQGSVTELCFPADSFDKILCTSVLQYLNDEECEAALREMTRVCKSGGIIVIHAKNKTSLYGLALHLLRLVGGLIRRPMVPDYYRPRRWYGSTLAWHGARIVDFDAFGIFHFPPLPESIVHHLLKFELRSIGGKFLKRFGVNYKMTVRVEKGLTGAQVEG